jgi:hypothetical protein
MAKKTQSPNGNPRVMSQLTLNELRGILSDEIYKIRAGKGTAASVNAISNASGKILSSIKLELEYYKLIGKTPSIKAMLPPEEEPEQPSA